MQQFWEAHYSKPLGDIPWRCIQSDWFKKLVDEGGIKGKSALDLGCGTGEKSLYLNEKAGFEDVLGVDISEKAIEYARANAKEKKLQDRCSFLCHDLTDWSFMPEEKQFDFILDWAAIHCLPRHQIEEYANNITRYCKQNGLLLIRSFSSDSGEREFEEGFDGLSASISLYSEAELIHLFSRFNLVAKNISQPSKKKVDSGYCFIELLLQKKKD